MVWLGNSVETSLQLKFDNKLTFIRYIKKCFAKIVHCLTVVAQRSILHL